MNATVGALALALALAVYVELLERIRRVDVAPLPWWFGYARDGANLAAGFLLHGAYRVLGLPTPAALCAAMLTALVVYILDWIAGRALEVRRARLVLAAPLGAWVALMALAPDGLTAALNRLIVAVQPP